MDERPRTSLLRTFWSRKERRLARDYYLICVFLIGGGLITSGLFEIYFRYNESQEQVHLLQKEVAEAAGVKIEHFLRQIENSIWVTTKSREIVLKGVTPDYAFDIRNLLMASSPITEAAALDVNGLVIAQVSRLKSIDPKSKPNLSTTPAFRRAKDGKIYFGPVYFERGSEPYMTIAVPIEPYAGNVIGVLKAEINLKYIWKVISGIQIGQAGYAYVVNQSGFLIAHPDINLVLQRRNVSLLRQVQEAFKPALRGEPRKGIITENLQGNKVLSFSTLLRDLGWAVIIELPIGEAFEKLYASLFRTSILLLVGLGTALLATLFIVRRVIRPVETLRQGAERIGSGDLGYRLEIRSGDELETLAAEFNKMGAALKESQSTLEEKVEERTRELVEANSNLDEAKQRLEEWNQKLEEKVREQVDELERAGRIKRYLSPQIAESLLNADESDLFKTHRREVTVVFMDLRGFTNFSDSAEPEEVMQFLRSYHTEIGNLIFKYEGTLEHFAGDGIMVFFNDPIPRENHIEMATRMVIDVKGRVNELRPDWLRKGYDLDVGVGMTTGFATLGTIGFEGRMDYGAIGNVTIMASRLSSEAKGGQILTNRRTLAKIEGLVVAEHVGELHLKGFARPISTFNIISLKESAGSVVVT